MTSDAQLLDEDRFGIESAGCCQPIDAPSQQAQAIADAWLRLGLGCGAGHEPAAQATKAARITAAVRRASSVMALPAG